MLMTMKEIVLLLLAVSSCCHAQLQAITTETDAMKFIAKQRYVNSYQAKADKLQALLHNFVLQPLLYSAKEQLVPETYDLKDQGMAPSWKDQDYAMNMMTTTPTTEKSETTIVDTTTTGNMTVGTTMIVTNVTMELPTTMTVTNVTMEPTTLIVTDVTIEPVSQCVADLKTFQSDIFKEPYALTMLDSYGKLPPGILQGNLLWLGLYDQCLNQSREINDDQANFNAQYCLVELIENNNPQPLLSVGTCVPDSCKSTELMDLLNVNGSNITVLVNCNEKFDYSSGAIACITLLAFLCSLILLGTAIEVFSKCKNILIENDGFQRLASEGQSIQTSNKEIKTMPVNGPSSITEIELSGENKQQGFLVKFLLCFSLLTNGSKILKTKQGEGSLGALNGFRVLSLWWVILGHSYAFTMQLLSNPSKTVDVLGRFTFQAVGNATFSVDSFFFLSGLLITYLTMKYLQKNNGKLNWVMFYVHRYLRLTPVYMLVIFIFTTLSPYFATGPLYSFLFNPNPAPGVENSLTFCQDYWWTNLLYINNLYPSALGRECLGWSWYLANDMQFFIISPFVIYLLYHYFFIGMAAWGVLLITSFGSLIGVSIKYNITTSLFPLTPDQKTFMADEIYVRPWARISTYLVGMAVGYILYKYRGRVRMSPVMALLGWLAATAIALAVVYGLYGNFNGNPLSEGASVVYITFSRFSWAVALAWVAFACATGYGGPVNSLLAWPFWIPLARISYCAYLLHPIIMFVFYYSLPTTIYFSDFLMVYFFLGHLVLSYAGAFVLSVCAEAPFMALEKLLLKRDKSV